MKKTSKPIVFFGSGPVAAESLRLLSRDFTIEAVVTKPATVKEMTAALKDGCIYSVSNKQELDELFASKPFQSEVGVLVDFGIIVSRDVIDYFPLGIVNSHFSLLPELRGADPITFSILNGDKRTGVSLMLLVEAMDEGPVLACGIQELDPTITTPELTKKLINLSDALLKKELPRYLGGQSQAIPQEKLPDLIPDYPSEASYSRKLTKEDGVLNWSKSAEQLEREIRAFIEWPKSHTTLGGKEVIITKAHVVPGDNRRRKPGDIDQSLLQQGILTIETGSGQLCVDMLKPTGKQEMTGKAFLAGYKRHLLT